MKTKTILNSTAQKQREIFAERLNYYIKKKGVTQSDIVATFNLTASTVSDWCNAKKYPRVDKIQMLADYFGILKSDLTEESLERYNPVIHKIPILGCISAGSPLYADEHIEGYTYTERNGGAEYFALKVKGDSMSAAQINDGNTIIVRKQDIVENGEIAVVRVNSENATVKRFRREGNIVQLIPQSFNPIHEIQIYDLKNTEVVVIGKVVECKIEF